MVQFLQGNKNKAKFLALISTFFFNLCGGTLGTAEASD
jgi:hypothetical protein